MNVVKTRRWAPKTRKGCLTCRQRHIKCDESRPVCRKCFTGNRICPGYADTLSRGSLSASLLHLQQQQPTIALPRMPRFSLMLNSSKEILDIILLGPTVQPQVLDNRCRHAHMSGLRLGIGYRGCMELCFDTISQSLGHEPALDAAVRCLSEAMRYQACNRQGPTLTLTAASKTAVRVLSQYGNALSALQQAVCDPVRSRSPLTLWAIELLCCFEAFSEGIKKPSLEHVLGSSRLVEFRGPDAFKTKSDRHFFAAKIRNLYLVCLLRGERSFLEGERWQQLMLQCIDRSSNASFHHKEPVVKLYCIIIFCSGAWQNCLTYIASSDWNSSWRDEIRQDLQSIRDRLLAWHDEWAARVFSDRLPDRTLKLKIHEGEETHDGNMVETYCLYHNYLATTNRSLAALGDPNGSQLERESRNNAYWMLSSTANNKQEPLQHPSTLSMSPSRVYNVDNTMLQAPMTSAHQLASIAFARASPTWLTYLERLQHSGLDYEQNPGLRLELGTLYKKWLDILGFGTLLS